MVRHCESVRNAAKRYIKLHKDDKMPVNSRALEAAHHILNQPNCGCPLTVVGEESQENLVSRLQTTLKGRKKNTVILSSPYERCYNTALKLKQALGDGTSSFVVDGDAGEARIQGVYGILKRAKSIAKEGSDAVIVSHSGALRRGLVLQGHGWRKESIPNGAILELNTPHDASYNVDTSSHMVTSDCDLADMLIEYNGKKWHPCLRGCGKFCSHIPYPFVV